MFCNANCMILHPRGSANVSQYYYLNSPPRFEGRLLLLIFVIELDLLPVLVHVLGYSVLVGVILRGQREEDDGKYSYQDDGAEEHKLKGLTELLVEHDDFKKSGAGKQVRRCRM